jgi:phosphoenolpyruvate carboxylase
MDEIAGKLKVISNEIGENIYENVSEAMEKRDAMQEAKKAEYEELKRKYRELSSRKIYGHDRLIKAFPGMKSRDYNESLVKLKEHVKKIVRKEQEMEG